jgi:hypothetical protein
MVRINLNTTTMNYLELDWKCGDFIESNPLKYEETYHVTTEHEGITYTAIGTMFINPRTYERELIKVEHVSEDVYNRLADIFRPLI